MDNINDILRAKRIVRQNGYRIEKPARNYDYEREDRMNLIRAKRIVKDAGYSYTKPTYNTGVESNEDDFDDTPRSRFQRTGVNQNRFRAPEPDFEDVNNQEDYEQNTRPFMGKGRFVKRNNVEDNTPAENNEPPQAPTADKPRIFRTPDGKVYRVKPRTPAAQPPVENPAPTPNAAPAPEAPATEAPAQEEQPRRKTRQEIYADIAARYV